MVRAFIYDICSICDKQGLWQDLGCAGLSESPLAIKSQNASLVNIFHFSVDTVVI